MRTNLFQSLARLWVLIPPPPPEMGHWCKNQSSQATYGKFPYLLTLSENQTTATQGEKPFTVRILYNQHKQIHNILYYSVSFDKVYFQGLFNHRL